MDPLNYKEGLETLRKSGFTDQQIRRLYHLPQEYRANPLHRGPAVLAHLTIVRWLVEHGRLTEHIA